MTTIHILDNKYCRIDTDNFELIATLRKILSYRLQGFEYTPAYKNFHWDGITYLLDKHNKFLLGLLSKVENYLKNSDINYSIIDCRQKLQQNQELVIYDRLQELGMQPRDYQERILEAALNNEKGIVRACTGSGKSLAAALIASKFNRPTVIYVIGLNLLKQFYELFRSIFGEDKVGYVGNGVCNVNTFTIASIWTVGRALDLDTKKMFVDEEDLEKEEFKKNDKFQILKMLKLAKIHIFDESHVCTTQTISSIFKAIEPERIYGLSGTPFRSDGSDLLINGILGEQIIDISASELIEKGILAKPYIKFFTVPKYPVSSKNYHTIYKEYIVENPIRNKIIVEQTQKLLEKGYAPLVLFRTISHGKILADFFTEAGVKFEMLYGNDSLDKRIEVINMFKNGEIEMILSSNIFSIGLDVPKLSALVNASGSKSYILTLQRVGRVIRGYPGKKYAAIVDLFDQVKYLKNHSKIRYEIYRSEKGFEVSAPKEMTK
jgi:superfamily II DNA or RNA helicase